MGRERLNWAEKGVVWPKVSIAHPPGAPAHECGAGFGPPVVPTAGCCRTPGMGMPRRALPPKVSRELVGWSALVVGRWGGGGVVPMV